MYIPIAICELQCMNDGTCSAPNTCTCASGWTDAQCQTGKYSNKLSFCIKIFVPDINECQQPVSPCQQDCTNTQGSYVCSCDTGYVLQTDGTCEGNYLIQ